MDEHEFETLAADLPGLTRVGRFVQSLDGIPWFANLGEPLTPGAQAAGRTYADGLGFPDAEIAIVPSWDDAAAAAEHLDWNSPSWEAEELLRSDVTHRAHEMMSEEALKFSLAAVADSVAEHAAAAVEEAAVLLDLADEEVRELAVGSAVQAAHQALLAIVTEADAEILMDQNTHPFAAKFQLFEFGRWPVGIAGRTLNLF